LPRGTDNVRYRGALSVDDEAVSLRFLSGLTPVIGGHTYRAWSRNRHAATGLR